MATVLIFVDAEGDAALVSWCDLDEEGRVIYEVDGWVRTLKAGERIFVASAGVQTTEWKREAA